MTKHDDPFLDDQVPADEWVDKSQLAKEVARLMGQHHPALVLGALLVVTVDVIQAVKDHALRKSLEWEYMQAYRLWSAMRGQVTPKEIDKPPPLAFGVERGGTIIAYLSRYPTNDND